MEKRALDPKSIPPAVLEFACRLIDRALADQAKQKAEEPQTPPPYSNPDERPNADHYTKTT